MRPLWNYHETCWFSRGSICSVCLTLTDIPIHFPISSAPAGLQSCVVISLLTNPTVIGRQVQLQQQLADTSAGHQIPVWSSSCQIVPLIHEQRHLLKADEEILLSRLGLGGGVGGSLEDWINDASWEIDKISCCSAEALGFCYSTE